MDVLLNQMGEVISQFIAVVAKGWTLLLRRGLCPPGCSDHGLPKQEHWSSCIFSSGRSSLPSRDWTCIPALAGASRHLGSPGSSVHGTSRPEHCSGTPFPSPRDLPSPGTEPGSPAWQVGSLPSESLPRSSVCVLSSSVLSDSLQLHVLKTTSLLRPWIFQEFWSGLPFPLPWDLPTEESNHVSCVSYIAGGFFTTVPPWEAHGTL